MDPAGTAIWIGGMNALQKVNLSTFTVASTQTVTGAVTSLATSAAQNVLVYTLVNGCCTSGSTHVTVERSISTMAVLGSHNNTSATPYAAHTMNGTLPSPALIPGASAVSAMWGNGLAASATPTGFVVYDVVSHQQIMSGSTPSPVRSISADPLGQVMYLTLPDTNEYVEVPLPHN